MRKKRRVKAKLSRRSKKKGGRVKTKTARKVARKAKIHKAKPRKARGQTRPPKALAPLPSGDILATTTAAIAEVGAVEAIGSLDGAIKEWVLKTLRDLFPQDPVTTGSLLTKWTKDHLNTLTNMAIAFSQDVRGRRILNGLVNPNTFQIPTSQYVRVVSRQAATVANIINYFKQRAEEAPP
jgi:hypothetical protein